jgi:hypothetical protein
VVRELRNIKRNVITFNSRGYDYKRLSFVVNVEKTVSRVELQVMKLGFRNCSLIIECFFSYLYLPLLASLLDPSKWLYKYEVLRGSVVIDALCYNPEGRAFETH